MYTGCGEKASGSHVVQFGFEPALNLLSAPLANTSTGWRTGLFHQYADISPQPTLKCHVSSIAVGLAKTVFAIRSLLDIKWTKGRAGYMVFVNE